MSTELKNIIKEATNGKKDPSYVMIKIREAIKVTDVLKKDGGKGIIELRVNTSDEKLPKQYTHAYLINLQNFNLKIKEVKNADQIKDILLNPSQVAQPDTRALLEKLDKDFGGIIPDGGKLFWRTKNFKKQKDPFQIKRKAM
jgi:hypothetical protein